MLAHPARAEARVEPCENAKEEVEMRNRMLVAGVVAMLLLGVGGALAVANKSYQVTGPIVSVTDDMIVVQKGKEHWELARDASTKIMGDLKVGEKVTIAYRMVATSVEVKTAMTKS